MIRSCLCWAEHILGFMQYSTLTMSNSLSFSSYSTFSSSSLKSGANALQFSCVKIQRSPVVWKLFFSHFTASFNKKWNLNQTQTKVAFNTTVNHNYHDNQPTLPPPHKKPKWIKIHSNPTRTSWSRVYFSFSKMSTKILDDNVKHNR